MVDLAECQTGVARPDGSLPRDLRRLIVVRKRWTGETGWSDAIDQFYNSVASCFSAAALVQVSARGITSLRIANRELKSAAYSAESVHDLVVLVNHTICWWALWPTLRRLKKDGATVVLCMHEHEHILGMAYVLRNFGALSWKEAFRHSRLYHGLAAKQASRVLILAEAQAAVLGINNAIRCSYLPVDSEIFTPDTNNERPGKKQPVILFAHDPNRFDKGHRFVGPIRDILGDRIVWTYGRERNLPFDQVYRKYWAADILFLPSDWESYSLVFIEALACNKFIVCSPQVGAARLLSTKYSNPELASAGIYITRHEINEYVEAINLASARVKEGGIPQTRKLFEEFSFDRSQIPLNLI